MKFFLITHWLQNFRISPKKKSLTQAHLAAIQSIEEFHSALQKLITKIKSPNFFSKSHHSDSTNEDDCYGINEEKEEDE